MILAQVPQLGGKIGRVARGNCSPRAPTDPYVPTLGHTAPRVKHLPRDVERPNAPRAAEEAGTMRAVG